MDQTEMNESDPKCPPPRPPPTFGGLKSLLLNIFEPPSIGVENAVLLGVHKDTVAPTLIGHEIILQKTSLPWG